VSFGPAGNRRWSGSGRPRGPQKPLKNMGGFAPPHFWMVYLAPGAAQTPNIDGLRPAQNSCIKNQSVLLSLVSVRSECKPATKVDAAGISIETFLEQHLDATIAVDATNNCRWAGCSDGGPCGMMGRRRIFEVEAGLVLFSEIDFSHVDTRCKH
jgi:hypothetical protein